MEQRPVFGIGLPRNATTSLAQAFHQLGYQTYHPPLHLDVAWYNQPRTFYADTPVFVPELFQAIDRTFPALFIYTYRDVDSWMASVQRFGLAAWASGNVRHAEADHWAYPRALGWPFDEAGWRQRYQEHQDRVREHFRGRDDYLELSLAELAWAPICRFLGEPVPAVPFPHTNYTVPPGCAAGGS